MEMKRKSFFEPDSMLNLEDLVIRNFVFSDDSMAVAQFT